MKFNVDKQIKTYWNKFIGLTDANNEEFADATSENSIRASKFLEGLNLDPIMPEINKHYTLTFRVLWSTSEIVPLPNPTFSKSLFVLL
jgi:hypothetical protein